MQGSDLDRAQRHNLLGCKYLHLAGAQIRNLRRCQGTGLACAERRYLAVGKQGTSYRVSNAQHRHDLGAGQGHYLRSAQCQNLRRGQRLHICRRDGNQATGFHGLQLRSRERRDIRNAESGHLAIGQCVELICLQCHHLVHCE